MNKEERAALLKEVLEAPDVPRKIAPKNLLRFVDRMQPETQEMRDYLMDIFSAETRAESHERSKVWYDKMTPAKQKAFDEAYLQCIYNDLGISDEVSKQFTNET